jgi:membrane-bound lytic murein transglycosylase B
MRSLIGGLFLVLALVFALTACAPLSKQDSVRGDAGEIERKKAEQQEQYNAWFQSLTPEQRAREFQRQHERALSP